LVPLSVGRVETSAARDEMSGVQAQAVGPSWEDEESGTGNEVEVPAMAQSRREKGRGEGPGVGDG